ncbi:uncharacterized protein LOC120541637 [Polypterus senegalus]|uniref:uncharacterized protein LOC120541637 n=1 Tax=Polypterus senegalus TaxID=55291 RepID=UPI0019624B9F|nr:uncharacterized protein LOC120541637 [Polypterus senegalus]
MAATLGHMDDFDENVEQWTTYIERFETFALANDIGEDKLVPVLLTVIGRTTYGLLRSLLAPEKPRDKTFDQIKAVLQQHFSPKPLVITERFRFHKRNQAEGESVSQYVAVLKKLSEHCEFGAYLEEALRDRFVCGLNNEAIQKRLLTEVALTYKKAVEIAISMEMVARESQQLCGSLKVNELSVSDKIRKCKRCGRVNHSDSDCWYKDQDCHNCGKKGHAARVCKQKESIRREEGAQYKGKSQRRSDYPKKRPVNRIILQEVSSEASGNETDTELALHKLIQEGEKSHISVKPKIEGTEVEMELDTGAAVSLISIKLYKKLLSHVPLETTDVVLKTYTGNQYPLKELLM